MYFLINATVLESPIDLRLPCSSFLSSISCNGFCWSDCYLMIRQSCIYRDFWWNCDLNQLFLWFWRSLLSCLTSYRLIAFNCSSRHSVSGLILPSTADHYTFFLSSNYLSAYFLINYRPSFPQSSQYHEFGASIPTYYHHSKTRRVMKIVFVFMLIRYLD